MFRLNAIGGALFGIGVVIMIVGAFTSNTVLTIGAIFAILGIGLAGFGVFSFFTSVRKTVRGLGAPDPAEVQRRLRGRF